MSSNLDTQTLPILGKIYHYTENKVPLSKYSTVTMVTDKRETDTDRHTDMAKALSHHRIPTRADRAGTAPWCCTMGTNTHVTPVTEHFGVGGTMPGWSELCIQSWLFLCLQHHSYCFWFETNLILSILFFNHCGCFLSCLDRTITFIVVFEFLCRFCLGPIAWPMLGACSSHSEAHVLTQYKALPIALLHHHYCTAWAQQ